MFHCRLCCRCTLASIKCRVKRCGGYMWSKSNSMLIRYPAACPIIRSRKSRFKPPWAAFFIQ